MPKVLSTKLKVDEVDRFTAIAEQQGESKAGLLRRLVEDYMNSRGTGGGKESTGSTIQTTSSGKSLPPDKTYNSRGLLYYTGPLSNKPLPSEGFRSKDLISIQGQWPTGSPTPAPVTIGLRDIAKEGRHSDSIPSSKESLPVYQNESKGRRKASTKPSTGNGWLLLMIPLVLWLKSHTSIVVDGKSRFIAWN